MIYGIGDMVRVYNDGELLDEMVVTWVSDDEEEFSLANKDTFIRGVRRENVLNENDSDKLAYAILKKSYAEVKNIDDEIDGDIEEILFQDVSLQAVSDNFKDVNNGSLDDVFYYFLNKLGYYGSERVLFDGEMFYYITNK